MLQEPRCAPAFSAPLGARFSRETVERVPVASAAPRRAGHLERGLLSNKRVSAAFAAWALFPVPGSA